MKIKTNFDLDQEVFYFTNSNILSATVVAITIDSEGIIYTLDSGDIFSQDDLLFESKELAGAYWLNQQGLELSTEVEAIATSTTIKPKDN